MLQIILVHGLCPLKIKITRIPGGFRLNLFSIVFPLYLSAF